jgi:hypothetical protein
VNEVGKRVNRVMGRVMKIDLVTTDKNSINSLSNDEQRSVFSTLSPSKLARNHKVLKQKLKLGNESPFLGLSEFGNSNYNDNYQNSFTSKKKLIRDSSLVSRESMDRLKSNRISHRSFRDSKKAISDKKRDNSLIEDVREDL